MRFLKEEEIKETTEDGKVSIKIDQLSTSLQGKVLSMSGNRTLEGQIEAVQYLLLNHVTEVIIDGESYGPKEVALNSDLSDNDTLTTVIKIYGLCLDAIVLGDEDRKKLLGQASQKRKGKGVMPAPSAKQEGHQKPA